MALPKLSIPTYELTIPSSGEKLTYRPFLVKEEKILLMATEGGDQKSMTAALKQIVSNCSEQSIDVERLKIYDLEYIFLQLRSRSVGEVSELKYICQNVVSKGKKSEKKCEAPIQVSIDLSTIEVKRFDGHEPHLPLSENVGIVLKDPEVSLMEKHDFADIEKNPAELFNIIIECIDHIYDGEQTFKSQDYKKEEVDAFLGSLTQKQFQGVKTFFDTIPKLEYDVELKCKKCNNQSIMTLRGLGDFFM